MITKIGRHGLIGGIVFFFSASVSTAAVLEEWIGQEPPKISYPVEVGKERQLFVDDALIESMLNLSRMQHPAVKYAQNPILTPQKPWEFQSIILMSVMQKPEGGGLRMWYSGWGKQLNKPTFMCIADSQDGIQWTRPNVGLVEFEGSKENNIIREGRMFRVLYDPDSADSQQRYKAIIRVSGFHWAFSPDGLTWTLAEKVLDGAFDASSVHWDPAGKKWIASCKLWRNEKRVRGYAESNDFVHWSDICYMLEADEKDGPADQLYSMTVHRYESLYVGFLKVYDTSSDRCRVEMAFSRDAKHWQRPDRTPFLANPPEKTAWDYANIDQPENIIYKGDELWLYYTGRRKLHNEKPNDGSIGLATLRRDGFVSLDAGSEEGILTTRPLLLKHKTLFLNTDAKAGQIAVEILDAADSGKIISPFSKGNCIPISVDSVRQPVVWKAESNMEFPHDKPVRLRFYLKNAKLYSFWTE